MSDKHKLTESFIDQRRLEVRVGDDVVYVPGPVVERLGSEVKVKAGWLTVSKVKEIRWFPDTGFAYIGNTMHVVLEDGSVHEGDSENSGFGLMKLATEPVKTMPREVRCIGGPLDGHLEELPGREQMRPGDVRNFLNSVTLDGVWAIGNEQYRMGDDGNLHYVGFMPRENIA